MDVSNLQQYSFSLQIPSQVLNNTIINNIHNISLKEISNSLENIRIYLNEEYKNKDYNEKLEKVRQTRQQGRAARQKAAIPTISLVGYTNAGKSTLFNRLTESYVYVADQLFATLDPTLRRVDIESIGTVVLADTVGFIRHLPHQLVKAFRATLEETLEADLLLHVVDTVSEDRDIQINAVNEVLAEIGNKTPVLMVYNKIDCLESHEPRIVLNDEGTPAEVWLSARDGMGIAELKTALAQILVGDIRTYHLQLQPQYAKLRAQLFALNAVKAEVIQEDGAFALTVRLSEDELASVLRRVDLQAQDVGVQLTPKNSIDW